MFLRPCPRGLPVGRTPGFLPDCGQLFVRHSLWIAATRRPRFGSVSWESTKRTTRQPPIAASKYFSASAVKPRGVVCLPRTQIPPSISINVRDGRWAKSARHFRVGWNRNSLSSSGPFIERHNRKNRCSSLETLLRFTACFLPRCEEPCRLRRWPGRTLRECPAHPGH